MSSINSQNSNITHNAISLEQLATLVAAELAELVGTDDEAARKQALQAVSQHVSAACLDDSFVAKHLPIRASDENVREVLYEDRELGFCICGHVYADAAHGGAHDHGPSWAIYGQAEGETVMSDWQIAETKTDNGNSVKLVKKVDTYTLARGDVHVYDISDVHSPSRDLPVKLIRVEGENLDNVERSKIKELKD